MSRSGKPNPLSGLTHENLPRFILHGFTAKKSSADPRARPAVGKVEEYISKLPPLYNEPVMVRGPDGTLRQETRSHTSYVQSGYLGLDINETDHEYVKTDLDGTIDLTKFMVNCRWETMTTAPYANASVELRLPSQLLPFLFHGEPADSHVSDTQASAARFAMQTGFRHIEAGGWASIRFPYLWSEGANREDSYRTVFFGKILNINVRVDVDEESVFNSSVTITVGSFIQPLTVAESRKTIKRVDRIADIDPAAMGSYDAQSNTILKALVRQLQQMRAGDRGVDMYDSLRYMVKSLGYMELPTDIAGRDPTLNKAQRLGDNLHIMGEYQDTTVNTIYANNAADINTVQGRPEEKYFTAAFMSQATTVWGIIQSMFQPTTELIELFPLIIPLDPSGNALSRAAGGGGDNIPAEDGSISTDGEWKNTDVVNSLKSVLYIMYRYKPMPPTFYGDKQSVDANNARRMGLRPVVVGTETNHEKFFGTHERTAVATNLETGVESRTANGWNPEFVYINEAQIQGIDLTWSDMKRVNAVNLSLPYAEGQTGANNLFGVECVPVFNQEDINRHGLRMRNLHTPFASDASSEHIRQFNANASSGMAERLYYLVGEGHAYAEGEIRMVYTPNPDLTAGIWCQTHFKKGLGSGNPNAGFIVGSGGQGDSRSKPLTYYVTAVQHLVQVDTTSGTLQGQTLLTVERASYGNRIPAVALNQVSRQSPPPPPQDTRRTRRRPKRRARRRR